MSKTSHLKKPQHALTLLTTTAANTAIEVRNRLVCNCVKATSPDSLRRDVVGVRVRNIPLNAQGQASSRGQWCKIEFAPDRFLRLLFCKECLRLRLDMAGQVIFGPPPDGLPDSAAMRSVTQLLESPNAPPPAVGGICVRSVEEFHQLRVHLQK